METNKVPTAEQFLQQNNVVGMIDLIAPLMIEFAKLHVKAALKEASQEACTKSIRFTDDEEVDKESILNDYPENLIK